MQISLMDSTEFYDQYLIFKIRPSCLFATDSKDIRLSTMEISKRLGISKPMASQSVRMGEKLVKENRVEDSRKSLINISIPVPVPVLQSLSGILFNTLSQSDPVSNL